MAKNKSSNIPHYELLYIISNKYSEDELKPLIEGVRRIVKDNNGVITGTEEWGKKKLAYPIRHFNYGYYILTEFDVSGENIPKIDRALRMKREVLRHQIVVKRVKTEAEVKKEKEISKKIAAKTMEKEKKKLEKEKIEQEKKKTGDKIDLKDLDAKLDKILETDDLL